MPLPRLRADPRQSAPRTLRLSRVHTYTPHPHNLASPPASQADWASIAPPPAHRAMDRSAAAERVVVVLQRVARVAGSGFGVRCAKKG
jgi:hypothetical protein